jgi:threonine synthase
MAQAISFFLARERRTLTIAVATSGDTGSAVAHGFFDVPQIAVFILYPAGKISSLQEQQMTTLGHNIHALEVDGSFDDCQRLVKRTLADPELVRALNLTTANSINVGRLVPQIVYYVWALALLKSQLRQTQITAEQPSRPVVVVPSGNFGNLTAAVYSKWMGNPIDRYVAATNANTVVPEFFETGTYSPRPAVSTYSNAMDVGDPSNFARLRFLYNHDLDRMKRDISSISISDEDTLAEIRRTYDRTGYVLDPHTAVGVAAARSFQLPSPTGPPVIVAATAHPAKFPRVTEKAIGKQIALPPPLQEALSRPKISTRVPAEYSALKEVLLHTDR